MKENKQEDLCTTQSPTCCTNMVNIKKNNLKTSHDVTLGVGQRLALFCRDQSRNVFDVILDQLLVPKCKDIKILKLFVYMSQIWPVLIQ